MSAYIDANPEKKRDSDELKDLETKNQIKPGKATKVSEIEHEAPSSMYHGFMHHHHHEEDDDSLDEDSFRRRSICFLLRYFTAVPQKRVNSPSMTSRTKASHLSVIFFNSIIILTDSRADDESFSSLTAMI